MSDGQQLLQVQVTPPSRARRLFSVWYRHFKVYTNHLISNGLPPFVEPLFFLAGIGLGLGKYVGLIDGASYINFLAAGIMVLPAMYTSSFECTYGTFIRLEFDKVYDGMVSAPMTVYDLLIGEIIFAGTKGFFFSFAVLVIVSIFGLVESPFAVAVPMVGFLTGLMFGAFSLFITSFVKNINHFNFFFTGFLTPMFFLSGIVFPLSDLPRVFIATAQMLPLTHVAALSRALCLGSFSTSLLGSILYITVFTAVFTVLGVGRLKNRILV